MTDDPNSSLEALSDQELIARCKVLKGKSRHPEHQALFAELKRRNCRALSDTDLCAMVAQVLEEVAGREGVLNPADRALVSEILRRKLLTQF